ncbi:MAG: glutathione S-transferase family protein [bacterium]|nr:glutathione S-transferase family protein [bacterium]
MATLYHLPLCPFSRKVRLVLGEKKENVTLKMEKPWEGRDAFFALNPAETVPVFVDENGMALSDSRAICEFLNETLKGPDLLGKDAYQRAEIRRLLAWFDEKFNQEVGRNLVFEKVFKRQFGLEGPDSKILREGIKNLHPHLEYIGWLTSRRNWLAGDSLTLADIAAAAHISTLDYLGHVDWVKYAAAKEWYMRIKSRPSFRPLLTDRMPAVACAPHYGNLDF